METKTHISTHKPNPIAIVRNFIFSIILCPLIGAWLHAYALWFIPIIFLRIVSVVFIFLGIYPVKILFDFKIINNSVIMAILSMILGIFTYYLSWAIWLSLAQNLEGYNSFLVFDFPITHSSFSEIWRFFTNPDVLFTMIFNVGKTGTWGFSSSIISGFPLFVIWFLELILVFVGVFKIVNDFKKTKNE